ncbi:uncharacterized protein LOC142335962 isoform X3 [Convolutriloba macropyga]|uniref:uncharacterized protein LOC142335962 isoform X3 n=1 Tax=Convolutriloba macropyga TaxID=536237 RepID=UPI003F527018
MEESQRCFRGNSETFSEGTTDDFTFNAPVKLSPEEGEEDYEHILGNYDAAVEILDSDLQCRDDLAGISSLSRSSSHQNKATTSSSVTPLSSHPIHQSQHHHHHARHLDYNNTTININTNSNQKPEFSGSPRTGNSTSSSSAPNPKKHWEEKYKSSSSNQSNTVNNISSNLPSSHGKSPRKEHRANATSSGKSAKLALEHNSRQSSPSRHEDSSVSEGAHGSQGTKNNRMPAPPTGAFAVYSSKTSFNKKNKSYKNNPAVKNINSSTSKPSSAQHSSPAGHGNELPAAALASREREAVAEKRRSLDIPGESGGGVTGKTVSQAAAVGFGRDSKRIKLDAVNNISDQSSALVGEKRSVIQSYDASGASVSLPNERTMESGDRTNRGAGETTDSDRLFEPIDIPSRAADRVTNRNSSSNEVNINNQNNISVDDTSTAKAASDSRYHHLDRAKITPERTLSPFTSRSPRKLGTASSKYQQPQVVPKQTQPGVGDNPSSVDSTISLEGGQSGGQQFPVSDTQGCASVRSNDSPCSSTSSTALSSATSSNATENAVNSRDNSNNTPIVSSHWKPYQVGRRSPLKVVSDRNKHPKNDPPTARVLPMARAKPYSPNRNQHGAAGLLNRANSAASDSSRFSNVSEIERIRSQNLMTNPNIMRVEEIFKEVESLKTPDPILPFSVSASMGCGGGEPNNNNNRAANEAFDLESLLLPNSRLLDGDSLSPEQTQGVNQPNNVNGVEPVGSKYEIKASAGSHQMLSADETRVETDSPVMTDLELPKSGHLYSGRNPTSLREPSARSQELEEFSRAAAKKPASRREHSAKEVAYANSQYPNTNSATNARNAHLPSSEIKSDAVETFLQRNDSSKCNILVSSANTMPNASASNNSSISDSIDVNNRHGAHKSANTSSTATYNHHNANTSASTSTTTTDHRSEQLRGRGNEKDSNKQQEIPPLSQSQNSNTSHNSKQKKRINPSTSAGESEPDSDNEVNDTRDEEEDDSSSTSSSSSSSSEDEGASSQSDQECADTHPSQNASADSHNTSQLLNCAIQDASSNPTGIEEPANSLRRTSNEEVVKSEVDCLPSPPAKTPSDDQQSSSASVTPRNNSTASSRPSWSLASFGVRQLSTSPSPVKNKPANSGRGNNSSDTAVNSNSRSRSAKTAAVERNGSGSHTSTRRNSPASSGEKEIPAVDTKRSTPSVTVKEEPERPPSPPIKIVATRREHTEAIAAKNKDKIASVHPFSKTSSKKQQQQADVNSGTNSTHHGSSLAPLISPSKPKGGVKNLLGGKATTTTVNTDTVVNNAKNKEPSQKSSEKNAKEKSKKSKKKQSDKMGGDHMDISPKLEPDEQEPVPTPSTKEDRKAETAKTKPEKVSKSRVKTEDFNALAKVSFDSNENGQKIPNLKFVLDLTRLLPTAKPEPPPQLTQLTEAKNVIESEKSLSKRDKSNDSSSKKKHKRSEASKDRNESKRSKKHDSRKTDEAGKNKEPNVITHADELDATKAASSKKSKYHSGDVSSNSHVPLLTTTVAAAAMDQQAHHNAIALGGATGGSSRMMGSGTASSPLFCGSSQDNDSFSNSNLSGSEMASEDLFVVGGTGPLANSSMEKGDTPGTHSSANDIQSHRLVGQSTTPGPPGLGGGGGVGNTNTPLTVDASPAPNTFNNPSAMAIQAQEQTGLKAFYSEQARIYKRKADSCSKNLESCLDYAQAVIYYISYAIACLNSNDVPRAYMIFTSKEIKGIINVAMKLNVKYQNAALNQDRIDIVCVLLMKIRGYFEMQAFNVRKEQTVRYVGTLADFIRDRKINGGNGSTANQAPASPTQSVASFSSNGSGGGNNGSNHNAPSSDCSSQGGANNLTSGSGANVQMSSDMYTIFENYIDSSQHLIAAHDTWDQAALLLKRPNVAKFYTTVDNECGYTVNIQSSPEPFIQYCNAVINLIRPKMINQSHQQLHHNTATTSALHQHQLQQQTPQPSTGNSPNPVAPGVATSGNAPHQQNPNQ